MYSRNRAGFSLIELLVVVAIAALTMAITLAAVQRVREAANRAKCLNTMKQISLGSQHFHSLHGQFPTGCQGDDSAQPYMSWMARLLPFLEQQVLYDNAIAAFQAA